MHVPLLDPAAARGRPTGRRPSSSPLPADHEALLGLQRAAGNAAVAALLTSTADERARAAASRPVQRAVMAIDGASDDDTAKAITRNCLTTLVTKKQVQEPSGSRKQPKFHSAADARGAVYGPGGVDAVRKTTWAGIAAKQVAATETLYILAHGSGTTVGDLDAATLAATLAGAFDRFPGAVFTGKVKLVACYGASLKVDDKPVEDIHGRPITQPYAGELAAALSGRPGKFRPASVDGIAGISWVDEDTGRLTGFDVTGETALNPLDWVYDPRSGHLAAWFAALKERDPRKRKPAMEAVLAKAHGDLGVAGPTRVIGKAARRSFAVT